MNRYLFRATLAITSTLGTTASLYAAPPATADPLAAWVGDVNKRLDSVMVSPLLDASGTARVDFRRGADGTPTNVVVQASNGNLRRAAEKTIARVGILPPLPVGYAPDTPIGLQLLFANRDITSYERQRAAMLASASVQNTQLAQTQTAVRLASARP